MRLAPAAGRTGSERHEQMSTMRASVDLPPTFQAPGATRRVLRSVLELWGWGSATARQFRSGQFQEQGVLGVGVLDRGGDDLTG
jgi:hypothetical protein